MKFIEMLKPLEVWGVEPGSREWFGLAKRIREIPIDAQNVLGGDLKPYSHDELDIYEALVNMQVDSKMAAEAAVLFPDTNVFNQDRRGRYFRNTRYGDNALKALSSMAKDFVPEGSSRRKYLERLGVFESFVNEGSINRVA